MAKAPTHTRSPVTARGLELLALIAGAPNGVLMLTQEEGLDAVNAGYAIVDTGNTEGNTAAVSLTDAGRAALTGNGGVASKFAIRSDVPMPTNSTRRGRTSSYPFEMLDVNGSFHIPASPSENPEKIAARMQSSVSGARARFSTHTGEHEAVTRNEYQKDENGKFVKDANGKRIVTGQVEHHRPVKAASRDFKLAVVGNDDPDGAGVRIWRTA